MNTLIAGLNTVNVSRYFCDNVFFMTPKMACEVKLCYNGGFNGESALPIGY